LIFYEFHLDHPESLGSNVTSKDLAFEGDFYADWKVNSNVVLSVVTAFANPYKAVEQLTGRTKNFGYGMVYVGYSF
jgi:3-deoxy-D-manno-octulosonate 8-phosphate phosphatase KdsC-like HAD superfamily phosphatase